jgi:hypothetical protein
MPANCAPIDALTCSRVIFDTGDEKLETVATFVHVQNIYYTTRQRFFRHFDYGRFWTEVTQDRQVVKATAFAYRRAP